MSKSYTVGVVGATGLVGREMLRVLGERGFPASKVVALASERSLGASVDFGDDEVPVNVATAQSFAGLDIVLMSAGGEVSRQLTPAAVAAGAVVIDNSSAWRMDPEVPLVVPEVNPGDVGGFRAKGIIANPNCSTIQMVVALAPLHRRATLRRVVVATYQAVSGKGKAAMDELGSQVSDLFNQRDSEPKVFSKRIAFNCLPHVDVFLDDGSTKEERKMVDETRKILHLPNLGVLATCVRVPVFNGHSEAIVAEFVDKLTADEARALLREAPGVFLMDDPSKALYPTPIDADGSDATLVGRVREDPSAPNSLAFWCVADNLRKGAATNAVQIAELLVRDHLGESATH
ncbi:MAG: aspartate-semialdehyde dehydrogenase [Myxococcota bacterium]